MTTTPAHQTTPCANCPYRQDAPTHHWDRAEFRGVLDGEHPASLGKIYNCHQHGELPKEQQGLCAGWMLDQRARRVPSIRFRILLAGDAGARAALEAVNDGGHPMYPSVQAMCRANGVRKGNSYR